MSLPAVRLDKWLWAVRLYRTRTLAAEACRAGHVKIAGHQAKAARDVHLQEVIVAQVGPLTRTVKVIALTERRVGPKLVSLYLEDQTPPSEYDKARAIRQQPVFLRPKGAGRPTKKQRRTLLGLRERLDES